MKYHLTHNRNVIVKKASIGEDVEKLEPCAVLAGAQNGAAAVENSTKVPHKIKNRTTI